jgi:hypothetical protein
MPVRQSQRGAPSSAVDVRLRGRVGATWIIWTEGDLGDLTTEVRVADPPADGIPIAAQR